MRRKSSMHIGTSGWSYTHWDEIFYLGISQKERLMFYAEHFATVEVNSSFYNLPSEKTIKNWLACTPKDFVFSVKASRYITHVKKLNDPKETVSRFFKAIATFKTKIGPILFQLPPSFKLNEERLKNFIKVLPKRHMYTIEFRHPSWFTNPIYSLLEKNNVALCISDVTGKLTPIIETADFVYARLHGPHSAYQGSYPLRQLKEWKQKIEAWDRRKIGVYLYFDNDEKAYAVKDAKRLIKLLN